MQMEESPKLIEIKQDKPGFDRFIGSWLCLGEAVAVIDVGPANSAGRLLEALASMNIDRVDYVLLTHIHLDHAGGLAAFLDRFPMAKVVCHERGLKFMADPSRLWAGSLQVLGGLAEMYGRPRPVSSQALIPHTKAGIQGLDIIETPGHAPHHLSYHWQGHLFAGEAGGNLFRVQGREYLRGATPPRFLLSETLTSVDRLRALDNQPIFYAHFGRAGNSHQMLDRFRAQLLRWKEIIEAEISLGRPQDLEHRCVNALLAQDPELDAFKLMDAPARDRERYFIGNSVRGYLGFLQGDG